MLHTLEVVSSDPYRYSYSWKRSDPIRPIDRLRRFYKAHPGLVRFINFPLYHRWEQHPIYYGNTPRVYYEDRAVSVPSTLVFDALVWDVTIETFAHPTKKEPYRYRNGLPPKYPTMSYIQHQFLAPFRKENEKLILSEAPIRLSAVTEAEILLDWCLENAGLKLGRDFEFSKERQIIVKSDEFRLLLAEKLGAWPEFDMVFTTNHPDTMRFSITLDDFKPDPKEAKDADQWELGTRT